MIRRVLAVLAIAAALVLGTSAAAMAGGEISCSVPCDY